MCKLNIFDKLSLILVFIGSVNWGLIGLLDFNLVNFISLGIPIIERCIYVLVFVAALNLASLPFRCDLIDSDSYK
ncbi:DUF378 domain-containing protein [Clostridium sp. SM-530-WT-3G]|uniref:DUF378 domain-containing protein n=1 Tax=Clostridium sp. SM-530-WT-3G TaxID=2725303 RepID=UPI00145D7069|nr:DUF378 domain-containing protein [Clostridium sp. SM-530-WT-3G]